jgi:DNA (cytosine-5)-methyltransferase 1
MAIRDGGDRGIQEWLPLWSSASASSSVPSRSSAGARSLPAVGLFSGIGGIELGLARAGHPSLLLCEIDRGARAVLDARLPDIAKHDDICTLKALPKDTQLVAAGFPCQDLSQAGQTRGIEGARSGLVGEVFRLLTKSRVPWVVLENVPFMLQLARGQALEVIVSALEALGYQWAYRVVDARAFGVPQRRRRVYLVASLVDDPRRVLFADDLREPLEEVRAKGTACGFYWTEGVRGLGWAVDAVPTLKGGSTIGVPSPPAIWLPGGSFVTPDIRDAERLQGFRAGWTSPAESVVKPGMRWKLVGNAVCVPVASWLGRRLRRPAAFELEGIRPIATQGAWPRAAWNVGGGRFTADISEWPRHVKATTLVEFLRWPGKPLSTKATSGFLKRTEKGSLRFPPGFIEALHVHLNRMVTKESERSMDSLSLTG